MLCKSRESGVTLVELAVALAVAAVISASLAAALVWGVRLGGREALATSQAMPAERALEDLSRLIRASCAASVSGSESRRELDLTIPPERGWMGTCVTDPSNTARIWLSGKTLTLAMPGGSPAPLAPGLEVDHFSAQVETGYGGKPAVTVSVSVGGKEYRTEAVPRMAQPNPAG